MTSELHYIGPAGQRHVAREGDDETTERINIEFSGLVMPEIDGILPAGDHQVGTALEDGRLKIGIPKDEGHPDIEAQYSACADKVKRQQKQIAALVDTCLHSGVIARPEGYEYTPEQERLANRLQGIIENRENPDANNQ